jgi:hypothetical protein
MVSAWELGADCVTLEGFLDALLLGFIGNALQDVL